MSADPVAYRFSSDDFFQMSEAGVLDPDDRVELIEGEVVTMTPVGYRHGAAVARLTHVFVKATDGRAVVWVQSAIRLSDLSAPQPDISLLRWRADFYASSHPTPTDVLVAVEVSDTSARWDRRVKRPLYARAALPELWIVDLADRLIEVATVPGEGDYETIHTLRPGATLHPGAFPDVTLEVSELLG